MIRAADHRRRKIIIPGITVVERLCADVLVEAERRALQRLGEGLARDQLRRLDALCDLVPNTHRSFLAWLRQPSGAASPRNFQAIVARLADLRAIGLPPEWAQRTPERRLRQLSREGGRMTAQPLAELAPVRRRGLLVAIALDLMASLTDDAIDMHDRMVGRLFRKAENRQHQAMRDQRALIGRSVRHYATVGAAVIEARRRGLDPFAAIEAVMPWEAFEKSVADAAELINTALIIANWDEILRFVASIRLGIVTASHILKRLAAYPRQNALAAALAEIGRVERALFTLQLLQSEERRHLIQNRLNKGESRHQLAQAVFFHRLGEIRDRSFENQAHRARGLNLLVSAIVTWNTRYLGHAVQRLRDRGESVPDELLAHVWPTAWEHVSLTGSYSWNSTYRHGPDQFRPLREKLPVAA